MLLLLTDNYIWLVLIIVMTTVTTKHLTVIVIMATFPCTATTEMGLKVPITLSGHKERWIKLRSNQRGHILPCHCLCLYHYFLLWLKPMWMARLFSLLVSKSHISHLKTIVVLLSTSSWSVSSAFSLSSGLWYMVAGWRRKHSYWPGRWQCPGRRGWTVTTTH